MKPVAPVTNARIVRHCSEKKSLRLSKSTSTVRLEPKEVNDDGVHVADLR